MTDTTKEKIMTSMTPYAAAKIANERIKEEGLEKVLPPQMFYTYVNKGYIASVVVDNKKRVTKDGLEKWLVGYINKLTGNTLKETDENVDENQLGLFDADETKEVVEVDES